MKITLNQNEIKAAVLAHVLSQIQVKDPSKIEISFTATRGEEGIIANIDIPYVGLSAIAGLEDAVVSADTTTKVETPKAVEAAVAKTGKISGGSRPPGPAKNPQPVAKAAQVFAGLTAPTPPTDDAAAPETTPAAQAGDDAAPFAEGEQATATEQAEAPAPTERKSLFEFVQ